MIRNIDAKFKKPYNNCNLRKIIYHQYLPMFMSIFNLRGAQTDRFRYEVFQNLFFSPMNTGFLRDTVATVLTVYGIETLVQSQQPFETICCNSTYRLRYWNLKKYNGIQIQYLYVATVLTVYGIETLNASLILLFLIRSSCNSTYRLRYWNIHLYKHFLFTPLSCNSTYRLRYWNAPKTYVIGPGESAMLQQYLPFTVLKLP